MKKTVFHEKKHSDRNFVAECNVNTYYFTANIDPLNHMDMVDYSAYFILRNRQEQQNVKHIHYSAYKPHTYQKSATLILANSYRVAREKMGFFSNIHRREKYQLDLLFPGE